MPQGNVAAEVRDTVQRLARRRRMTRRIALWATPLVLVALFFAFRSLIDFNARVGMYAIGVSFPDAGSVSADTPVQYNGVEVGQVGNVILLPQSRHTSCRDKLNDEWR